MIDDKRVPRPRLSAAEAVRRLRELPKPDEIEVYEPIEVPDRDCDQERLRD